MNRFILFAFLFAFLFAEKSSAQIHINEWMSSNSSTISDPDFDNSGDWVELFNSSNQSVDLSGYFLSDNLGEPTKWQFPNNTSIPAQGFLLVWADGENTGLHSSFKLTKAGEEIGFYNSDTIRLDSVVFGFQQTDISNGRITDGNSTLGFFAEPTSGSSNTTQSYEGITFYPVRFSQAGGFFDAAFEVELSASAGQIRYTLNGSTPTESDNLYTSPISINETTNLRAKVFLPNQIPGPAVTHTYFFEPTFEARGLPVVSITTNPEYFWDADIGLYVQDFKPEWEYPINIELFENDGNNRAAINELAGTKVNGQNSWVLPQKMLGIYFDNEYGNNNIEYPLFFDRPRRKFDNFILRASGSDWGNTLFRDAMQQGLTTQNMDVGVSGFRPAIAYVNGEYMGIHNLRSRIDESYIEDNFGLGGSDYDLIANHGEVEQGDDIAYQAYYAMFDTDLSQTANYEALKEVLDIENFIDYYSTEIYSGNSSWGHNIVLWKPKAAGTKWRYILADLDRGFTGIDNDLLEEFTTSNNPSYYNEVRKPLREILENDEFSSRFLSRFCDHLYTTFHPTTVNNAISERENAIKAEIPYHVGRWSGSSSSYGNGLPSVAYWEGEVAELRDFANARPNVILEDLKDEFNQPDPVSLGLLHEPADGGSLVFNDINIPSTPWVSSYFPDLPITIQAVPTLGHTFIGWTTATNSNIIERESTWKYLDDGSNQGMSWRLNSYDDSNWSEGQAELGYGDGDETTTISFGNNNNDKHITTYFRKTFFITNLNEYTGQMLVKLKRDDGALVYLNGEEIVRSNMPTGTIDFETEASNGTTGNGEDTFFEYTVQSDKLKAGENTIAVEVHQGSSSSSDVSFDLELVALKTSQSTIISTDEILNLELGSDTFLIAQFEEISNCILPRTITENTTLTLACSPYLVPTDVRVLENVKLEIEAGVELHFAERSKLYIHGELDVHGTEIAPVIFKAEPNADTWGSVIFNNTTGQSTINWLDISGATQGIHPVYENAAISGFYADIDIDNLFIEDVENNPILGYYSNITLKNSFLHSKVTGDLINIKYGNGLVENCEFRGNEQVDTDAIDYDEVPGGIIRGNKIYDFLGYNSDGIDLGEASPDVVLENNFIHNCSDKAVSVGQQSNVFSKNNTIVNCAQGYGIKDISTADIDQNTFYNVAIPVASFEKNVGYGGGLAFVSNSILSNSPVSPFFVDSNSVLQFDHCISDTEFLPGMNTYFGNSIFENPTFNNFQIKNGSPAQGTGIDEQGNAIDLGTKSHIYDAPANLEISRIHYNPANNPDAEYIMLHNPGSNAIDLTGYVISEAFDYVFPTAQIASNETIIVAFDANLFQGTNHQVFQWTLGKLSNSGERIRITDANGIIVDQVIYDDVAPWPIEADGQGAWLDLISSNLDNHFAENWQANLVTSYIHPNKELELSIFPNPSSKAVSISSHGIDLEQIELINTLGQSVLKIAAGSVNSISIDVQNLQSGLYFIKINGIQTDEKLIVNR